MSKLKKYFVGIVFLLLSFFYFVMPHSVHVSSPLYFGLEHNVHQLIGVFLSVLGVYFLYK